MTTLGAVMVRARREAVWESWRLRGEIATPRAGWHRWADCAGLELDPPPCETCPVRLDCLAAAIDEEQFTPINYRHGWRGGVPAHHRVTPQVMRVGAAVCGTDSGYRKHRDRGEVACAECKFAHAQANRVKNTAAGRSNNHRLPARAEYTDARKVSA
jgi:hypothetical protein